MPNETPSDKPDRAAVDDFLSPRMVELLREAADRADDGRYPVDGQFLREQDVKSHEAIDLLDTLSTLVRGVLDGGQHVQMLVIMCGVAGDTIHPVDALRVIWHEASRAERRRLSEKMDDIQDAPDHEVH